MQKHVFHSQLITFNKIIVFWMISEVTELYHGISQYNLSNDISILKKKLIMASMPWLTFFFKIDLSLGMDLYALLSSVLCIVERSLGYDKSKGHIQAQKSTFVK